MATLKQRLHRKNASGTYDVVHIETSADMVLMTDGKTKLSSKISAMDTTIAGKAASSHTHPAQTTITGNAGSATKLATARTIRTNLASTTAASFNGTANVTPGVTGILPVANGGTGVTSLAALKTALGIDDAILNGIPTSNGSTVTWAGYSWVVVHVDSSYVYMGTADGMSLTKFNNEGAGASYAGSLLATKCTEFLSTFNDIDKAKLGAITVNGVTNKVFVPSYEQVSGGFSWFSAAANRGTSNYLSNCWWTSTVSTSNGAAKTVGCKGGALSQCAYYAYDYVFRPFIAFKR